jgi:hypothetical protein
LLVLSCKACVLALVLAMLRVLHMLASIFCLSVGLPLWRQVRQSHMKAKRLYMLRGYPVGQ